MAASGWDFRAALISIWHKYYIVNMFSFNIIMRAVKTWNSGNSGVGSLYFRIRAVDVPWSGDSTLQAILEISFFESGDATGVNLSLAATKSASSVNVNPANNAGDGNAGTYWQSTAANANFAWWQCKFAEPKTVRSVIIKPHTKYYAKSYALEYSNDGIAWVTVKTVPTTGVAGVTQIFLNIQ